MHPKAVNESCLKWICFCVATLICYFIHCKLSNCCEGFCPRDDLPSLVLKFLLQTHDKVHFLVCNGLHGKSTTVQQFHARELLILVLLEFLEGHDPLELSCELDIYLFFFNADQMSKQWFSYLSNTTRTEPKKGCFTMNQRGSSLVDFSS